MDPTSRLKAGRLHFIQKLVIIITITIVIGMVIIIVYLANSPGKEGKYTEFYIANIQQLQFSSRDTIIVKDSLSFIVALENHEYRTVSYRVISSLNESDLVEIVSTTLRHGDKQEFPVTIKPKHSGFQQKVELFLYQDLDSETRQESLQLWIDVID